MRMNDTPSKSDAVRRVFEAPEDYLARRFNIRTRAYVVRRLLGEIRDKSILDLGCGDGSISRQFLQDGNPLTLVDLSVSMLEEARRQTPEEHLQRTRFINDDLMKGGFGEEFDVVLCVGLLAHVDSVAETIRVIAAALRRGGLCVLQITDTDSLYFKLLKVYCALRGAKPVDQGYATNPTSARTVQALATHHGLRLVTQCRYALPMPGMLWLSDDLLFRYQVATLESRWLSRSGSEALFLFAKG
jgi:2-polyprenyl-3-methyl-5-hydroxy-6-metoxy-1,4-benzoquinol methylase